MYNIGNTVAYHLTFGNFGWEFPFGKTVSSTLNWLSSKKSDMPGVRQWKLKSVELVRKIQNSFPNGLANEKLKRGFLF